MTPKELELFLYDIEAAVKRKRLQQKIGEVDQNANKNLSVVQR